MTSTSPGSGTPFPGEGRRVRKGHVTSYGAGRACSIVDCGTLLSTYNSSATCSVHSRPTSGHGATGSPG